MKTSTIHFFNYFAPIGYQDDGKLASNKEKKDKNLNCLSKKKQQVHHPTDIFHYNHEVRVCNSVSPCVR